MRTVLIYSLNNIPMYQIAVLEIVSRLYICYFPSTDVSCNWKFVHFDHFPPTPPSPTPTSGNHESGLFFYEFGFYF